MAICFLAEEDDLRGRIDISTTKYKFTRIAIHRLSFPTMGSPKTEDIVNLINSNGLHRYTFASSNEDCRFWVYSYLEKEGVRIWECWTNVGLCMLLQCRFFGT
ncbi:hypothetical protein E4U40_004094 [Claviceps sp. LM458 group G5]|nr:hypothetical protein E4U40_004094 [Claviceps sp. LM458 group G5]